jgi:Family of unknown function (DUF5677)
LTLSRWNGGTYSGSCDAQLENDGKCGGNCGKFSASNSRQSIENVNLLRRLVGFVVSMMRRWLGLSRAFFRRLFRRKYHAMIEPKNYTLGHHLVAFLDVQGQRERFRELRLPQNAEGEAQVKEVLRQTAGFVVELRDVFRHQFEIFEKGANMGAHGKEPVRPNFVGFSDSFVTSVPLRSDNAGLVRIVTVFSALSAAAIVMLTSLASRHPLRGGIDVGLATEIGPGEIYGTGLERAYVLESEVAQYPRIIIGDEFWKYLNTAIAEFEKGSTPVAKSITAIVKRIMGLMALDNDGKRILDYLGPTMVEHAGPDIPKHLKHMVQPIYEFVLAEQVRQVARGDAKLIARYEQFRRYVESRLPLWGLSGNENSRPAVAEQPLPLSVGDMAVQKRFISMHEGFHREFPEIQTLAFKMFALTLEHYNERPQTESEGPQSAEQNSLRLAQIIVHYLARTVFDAFGDLLILAGNGRGIAARVMLRIMYEHLVTAAFIAQYPAEAKRFDDNASIQKIKIWNRTVRILPEVKTIVAPEEIQKLEDASKEAKALLKAETCKKCGQPITGEAWTRASIEEMAQKVDADSGSNLAPLYTTCFLVPTSFIHPTAFGLESRSGTIDDGLVFKDLSEPEAHDAVMRGHGLILRLLKQQNNYFQLGLDDELSARWEAFPPIWSGALVEPPPVANQEVPD